MKRVRTSKTPTPSITAHVDRFPPNKRIFTGLRFEVEQASRGLSAIAELRIYIQRDHLVK